VRSIQEPYLPDFPEPRVFITYWPRELFEEVYEPEAVVNAV
jgi:hypothetical protein